MAAIHVVPAYGRDYTSKKALQADWDAGKDFQISDFNSRWHGAYINKEDAKGDAVVVRYNKLKKQTVIS